MTIFDYTLTHTNMAKKPKKEKVVVKPLTAPEEGLPGGPTIPSDPKKPKP